MIGGEMAELKLKGKVQDILSLDAAMFPGINNLIAQAADYTEGEVLKAYKKGEEFDLQNYVANTLIVDLDLKYRSFALFSSEEIAEIKRRINEYQQIKASGKSAAGAKTGGAELLDLLSKIEYFKEGLYTKLSRIKEILDPKPVSRTTLAEAAALAQEQSIKAVAMSFKALPEKVLRSLAENIVGDGHVDYLYEELPILIAHKQITGEVLEPGEVKI